MISNKNKKLFKVIIFIATAALVITSLLPLILAFR